MVFSLVGQRYRTRKRSWGHYRARPFCKSTGWLDTSQGAFVLFHSLWHKKREGQEVPNMPVLLRKFKLPNGMMQQERIDDEVRIARYMKLFEKEDVKKLETGKPVWIEKDEWQLIPD
jgi:hypothetical protein